MRYQHDCDECKPLGEFRDCDLYFCNQGNRNHPTVIARYGNDESDYISGLILAEHPDHPEITEARVRAKAKGYL